jgi:hypothetical protein
MLPERGGERRVFERRAGAGGRIGESTGDREGNGEGAAEEDKALV